MCFIFCSVVETQPLFTPAEQKTLRPGVWGEVGRNSFIALPGTGGWQRRVPQNCVLPRRGQCSGSRVCQLVAVFLIGWWWGHWVSASSASWFPPVRGLWACGQLTVNFFHPVGAPVSADTSEDTAQNTVCSPWGGTKGPWLCRRAKLLLFCLAWLSSFLSAFSHVSDWIHSLAKALLPAKGHWKNVVRPHEVLLAWSSINSISGDWQLGGMLYSKRPFSSYLELGCLSLLFCLHPCHWPTQRRCFLTSWILRQWGVWVQAAAENLQWLW